MVIKWKLKEIYYRIGFRIGKKHALFTFDYNFSYQVLKVYAYGFKYFRIGFIKYKEIKE